jgi:hypothetical protein
LQWGKWRGKSFVDPVMPIAEDLFYTNLPVNPIWIKDNTYQDHLFFKLPETWQVFMVTISESDGEIGKDKNELHGDIIATGCIVCILSEFFETAVQVPYFFTSYGACFIIPGSFVNECRTALNIFKKKTYNDFSRVISNKIISIGRIYADGHELKVSKMRSSGDFIIPVILGDGLDYAHATAWE